jgi:histone H2A
MKKKTTQSSRAGLIFPVGRIGRYMRSRGTSRVSIDAPVYLTAVMEFLCAEILEISGESCQLLRKKRITPQHIEISVRQDPDF